MPFFGVPIRNGLPIGLGSVAGFGVQQFDPSQLFAGGTVAGAWYDPSDLSTMFTTSAGTTPVAMPGLGSAVSVGLMLDKSQGLVLGSELVTPAANRDFSSDTGYWTKGAGVTISGGAANFSSASGYVLYRLSLLPVGALGAYYEVTFTVTNYVSGSIRPYLGSTATFGTAVSANGTYTQRFCPTSGSEAGFNASVAFTGSIDNVSVKQVSGNHAISFNNTTARPELRARVNLLTYSEEINNSDWTKTNATITADAVANPLTGTVNADALFETTTNGAHAATQSVTTQAARFKYSVYLKANGRVRFAIAGNSSLGGNLGSGVFFDLSTGQYVSGAPSGATPSITDAGGGWWLVSYEWTANAAIGVLGIFLVDSGTNISYAGDITKGIYIWGADLRPANIGANVPAYQRIADANTYDTSGFPLYLLFQGLDDSMYTPANLNLSGTDKVAVFAGVRKLSDAATAILAELSVASDANNGAFGMFAPANSGANSFAFRSRGTVQASAEPGVVAAAPVTRVQTGIADISAPVVTLRLNGTQAATNAATQGAGNYGTYPLYIGSRNNASSWLNGQIYSLIIAGSAVSAGNISATEQWVAGRTGIAIP